MRSNQLTMPHPRQLLLIRDEREVAEPPRDAREYFPADWRHTPDDWRHPPQEYAEDESPYIDGKSRACGS